MKNAWEVSVWCCPLCASPCEPEQGYDDLYWIWSCSHELLGHGPAAVYLSTFTDSKRLEEWRSVSCMVAWVADRADCEARRAALAERPPGSRYIEPPYRCTWSPADRRKRHEWRRMGSTDRFSRMLKDQYLGPIREALRQGSPFAAAFLGELRDTTIQYHDDINRTAYSD